MRSAVSKVEKESPVIDSLRDVYSDIVYTYGDLTKAHSASEFRGFEVVAIDGHDVHPEEAEKDIIQALSVAQGLALALNAGEISPTMAKEALEILDAIENVAANYGLDQYELVDNRDALDTLYEQLEARAA